MCNYVHLVTGWTRDTSYWTVALGGFGIGGRKSGCTRQATTTLLKGTVSLDEDLNVLIITFCICADDY